MPSQWERFKQSNIAKIVIGYSLVVWVLIQLIEAVLPTFETPLWVAQTLTFLLILGFPIALLVGWAYEKLPTQSTSTDGAPSVPEPAHSTPKKTLVLVGIGSCAVIGLFGFYMMPFIFDQNAFDSASVQIRSENAVGVGNITPETRALRSSINVGQTFTRNSGARGELTLSPDGNTLVFSRITRPISSILVKDLDTFEPPRELVTFTATQLGGFPKFSRNGDWIYYYDRGSLNRIRIEGGASQTLVSDTIVAGFAEVDNDNLIVPGVGNDGLIGLLTISTGETSELDIEAGDQSYIWPSLIPGTRYLLATNKAATGVADSGTDLIDLDSGKVQTIIPIGYNARYVNSGHIVFIRGDALWALPFSPSEGKVVGQAVPAVIDVESAVDGLGGHDGVAGYSFSNYGRLVYFPGNLSDKEQVGRLPVWVDNRGVETPIGVPRGDYGEASISPTGDQVAMTVFSQGGASDIWVYDFAAGTLGRRTFEGSASKPIWSPDSSTIFFLNDTGNSVWTVAANGTSQPSSLLTSQVTPYPETLSPDSSSLVYSGGTNPATRDLWLVDLADLEAERIQEQLQVSPQDARSSAISHDGNWIAYASNETGDYEVYVRPFPNINAGKWQVSREGGGQPIWSKTENRIFYWAADNRKYASTYTTGPENSDGKPSAFRIESTEQLFTGPYRRSRFPAWDYSEPEKKFLLIKDTGTDIIDLLTEINIVENWDEELRRLAPVSLNPM